MFASFVALPDAPERPPEETDTGTNRLVASAWSVDGMTFQYQGPIGSDLRLGGYVSLSGPSGERVGQVLSQRVIVADSRREVEGHGRVLGTGAAAPVPFDAAEVTSGPGRLVRRLVSGAPAPLEVGSLYASGDIPRFAARTGRRCVPRTPVLHRAPPGARHLYGPGLLRGRFGAVGRSPPP
jgi:hypothetical protein